MGKTSVFAEKYALFVVFLRQTAHSLPPAAERKERKTGKGEGMKVKSSKVVLATAFASALFWHQTIAKQRNGK